MKSKRRPLKSIKKIYIPGYGIIKEDKAYLDERTREMKNGTAKYLNWDDVKDKL